ncbi:MAG: ORF6N domain-containing protein [Prevotella sp.]|nr:ORF6N domain-containing protein [Alistipes senegalensis]MCM1357439.1 ORF6N domain-containing protein [Prevotella sp.]MCM1473246.1 ORF6N domain-containing protein [Muribaculaceae bacterium]
MYELINNKYIKIKEYNGQRVVTFKDIDTVHERLDGTARKRFNDNKEHFIEGKDFFIINQPSEIRTLGIIRPQGGTPEEVILVTESGYLMIVKSFKDDLAWSVQRMLVNTYFQLKQQQSPEKYASMTKSDIVEGIKFFCEQNTERDLYFNKKIDNLNKKINSLTKENIKYKLILQQLFNEIAERKIEIEEIKN